jgi:hypothetical protein
MRLPWQGYFFHCPSPKSHLLLIPVNVVTDSDLIPGSDSDAMPVTIGAKRRW